MLTTIHRLSNKMDNTLLAMMKFVKSIVHNVRTNETQAEIDVSISNEPFETSKGCPIASHKVIHGSKTTEPIESCDLLKSPDGEKERMLNILFYNRFTTLDSYGLFFTIHYAS